MKKELSWLQAKYGLIYKYKEYKHEHLMFAVRTAHPCEALLQKAATERLTTVRQ
ncbi:MAG: hypothetical protein ACYSWP_25905 [Planctomycetota bacterium]|jgi:hypothetical protein